MAIKLSPLPYKHGDLEPFLSEESVMLHRTLHHQNHAENLNAAIRGTKFSDLSLADIVLKADGAIFRNAAQVWNHNFYWRCLTPESGKRPVGKLLEAIDAQFGTYDEFRCEFKRKVKNNFASGWTWLICTSSGKLKIINTRDSETPIVDVNTMPLLALDVWEHAYYLDYKGDWGNYVESFWNFVDWHFVIRNFERA
ncbi:MAG: Fe-Mn family superoxide dismutase [Arenicella sp.]|jgi:Fe-Mn family superoxide dismutase